jgi:hypothetical protein
MIVLLENFLFIFREKIGVEVWIWAWWKIISKLSHHQCHLTGLKVKERCFICHLAQIGWNG